MASGPEEICLRFLSNESEEDEGLGHAGIETYSSKPYAGVARETGQNSRDAALTYPVRLSFDLLNVPTAEVPAIESLRATVRRCLAESERDNREKETAFFVEAQAILAKQTLKVLRISDHNTSGARGPAATKGTPFYALTRSNGVSAKDREDSGGSYGIGKNAAFAVSGLRTVFYSTIYVDERGQERFLSQGKSVLVSHHDADGMPLRQIGYWGLPDFRAIDNPQLLPTWLRRSECGTSVFVLGFREEPDWARRIASTLLANFFPALHEGEMEFTVNDGKIAINAATLQPLFEDPLMITAAEANGHRPQFEIAREHYRCLISPEAKDHFITIESLGKVRIRVLVGEGLSKKICITRNGLVITDSLKNFGQPFSRFPMSQDFVAVVSPREPIGSAYIKNLEDPKHEELSSEGLPDEASRARAKATIKKLGNAIRDAIKADSVVNYESEIAANEMRRYFASGAERRPEQRTSPDPDPEVLKYRVEPKADRRRPTVTVDSDRPEGSETVWGAGPGSEPGPKSGSGPSGGPLIGPLPTIEPTTGPDNRRPIRSVYLSDVRTVGVTQGGSAKRRVYFTPDTSGQLALRLEAVGVNGNERLSIVEAGDASTSNGSVMLEVRAGLRHFIDVLLADPYDGPVDVRARMLAPELGGGES